jgi:hypothetical protein
MKRSAFSPDLAEEQTTQGTANVHVGSKADIARGSITRTKDQVLFMSCLTSSGIRFRDDVSGDGLCVIGSDSRVTTRQRKHPAGNSVSTLVMGGGLALVCCHRHYVDQSGAANHRGF